MPICILENTTSFCRVCRLRIPPTSFFYRGLGQYFLGHREAAVQELDRAYALDSSLMPARVGKALSQSIAGRHDSAVKLLRQTEDEMAARGVADAEMPYKITQAYAVLGEKSLALHTLQHTVEGGSSAIPALCPIRYWRPFAPTSSSSG